MSASPQKTAVADLWQTAIPSGERSVTCRNGVYPQALDIGG